MIKPRKRNINLCLIKIQKQRKPNLRSELYDTEETDNRLTFCKLFIQTFPFNLQLHLLGKIHICDRDQ